MHFTESAGDPFIAAALACGATERVEIGTAIALAFPRSPLDLAYSAWDLQELSGGRFVLGIGTQVRAHIERRYGSVWSSPAARICDFTRAVRAIWAAWQSGEELRYEGPFYRHTLMPANFRPPPLAGSPPPIMLAGVRERMLEAVGEVGDGLLGHSLQTPAVFDAVTLPALRRGLQRAGREPGSLRVGIGVFAATSEQRWESIRARIGFYASTPGYRHVLDHHGLGDLFERLHGHSRQGEWARMTALVSDEVMGLFVVDASDPVAGAAELKRRWAGRAGRLALDAGDRSTPEEWAELVAALGDGPADRHLAGR